MIRRSHFGDLALGRGSFGFRHGIREWLSGITVYRNGNREHCLHAFTGSTIAAALCIVIFSPPHTDELDSIRQGPSGPAFRTRAAGAMGTTGRNKSQYQVHQEGQENGNQV